MELRSKLKSEVGQRDQFGNWMNSRIEPMLRRIRCSAFEKALRQKGYALIRVTD